MRLATRSTLAFAATLLIAAPAVAADITVTTTADNLAMDAECTLREAITAARLATPFRGCASGTPGLDTVVLGTGTYSLTLLGYEDVNTAGDLDLGAGHELRILGAGPSATVIDAAGVDRVLDVPATTVLALEGLTVRGGRAAPGGFGGGVRNQGKLIAQRVTFTDNRAGLAMPVPPGSLGDTGPGGGAISMSGATAELVVADSTFDANRAADGGQGGPSMTAPGAGGRGGDGGAILVLAGTANIVSGTFTGNLAGNGGPGGGDGVAAGQGGNGGAIATFGGTTAVVNATFSANRAGDPGPGNGSAGGGTGGAIAGGLGPTAATSVAYSTFAGNLRGNGSTGGNGVSGVVLAGALLADAAPVCAFSPVARETLVPVGDASCGPGSVPGDARLGPLADNGGPTRTMLPAEGSAAIDLTTLCSVAFPLGEVDQRGVARIQRNGCDAGALEVAPLAVAPTVPSPPPTPGAAPAAPGAAAPGTTSVVLSGLRLTPAPLRAGRGGTITFRISLAARVVVTVRRTLPGRRAGARCLAPARAPRTGRACTRTVTLGGNISRRVPAGTARVRFTGRLDGVTLPPGGYTLVVRAVGGTAVARGFRVVR